MMPASDQGANFDRYTLIPRTLIFLTRGDTILLLKGSNNKRLWPKQYNGIGGHVEQGEDVLTAAQRELLEEAGLVSTNLWLCGVTTVDTQTNPGVCIYIFKGDGVLGEPTSSKEGLLEWVEISSLPGLSLVPDLPVLLPKILMMKFGEPPFSAHSHYDETGNFMINFA